jgi:hypothetical protein
MHVEGQKYINQTAGHTLLSTHTDLQISLAWGYMPVLRHLQIPTRCYDTHAEIIIRVCIRKTK